MRDGARRPARRSKKRAGVHDEGPRRGHSMLDEARRPCRRSRGGAAAARSAAAVTRAPRGGTGERTKTVRSQRHGQPGLHRGRGSRDAPTGPQGGALEGTVPSEQGAAAGGEERGFRCDGRRRRALNTQLQRGQGTGASCSSKERRFPNPNKADGKMPHFTHAG